MVLFREELRDTARSDSPAPDLGYASSGSKSALVSRGALEPSQETATSLKTGIY